ncbi:MAG: DUF1592 domain-containing protein [Lentisphaeraceae bacterium]|nr:DUF1592 domain-containing protein [Lentisphaeraceae bacterium]
MKLVYVLVCLFSLNSVASDYLTITKKHCYDCHNPKKKKGDTDLTVFNSTKSFYVYYDLLKDFYHQVESGEMPPEEDSKMTASERKVLVDHLGQVIFELENTASHKTGSTVIRRLTDYEYDNSVKYVTGLDLDLSEDFPGDGGGGEGFTNDSAIMGVSPLLFEKYLAAAEAISAHSHFGLIKGFSFSDKASVTETRQKSIAKLDAGIDGLVSGLYPKDFNKIAYLPKLMFVVNEYHLSGRRNSQLSDSVKQIKLNELILRKGISYFASTTGKSPLERDALREWFMLKRYSFDPVRAKKAVRKFTDAYKDALANLKSEKDIKQRSFVIFRDNIRDLFAFGNEELSHLLSAAEFKEYQELVMAKDALQNGMRSKFKGVFAKKLIPHLKGLMTKAHRKPPEEKELLQVTADFISATAEFGLASAARMFVIRTFAHMKFIYRHEEKLGKTSKVSDYELASRLSYFLWGMPPDDKLMNLAAKNELSQRKALEAEVKRMLKDPKAVGLAKYFSSQWLNYDNILESTGPSTEKFPEFTKTLARDMWKETVLFLQYIFRNNRSVLEIIDSDYTFLNARMRAIYGMERVSNFRFAKVKLEDKKRGGIIGHSSILTLTSGSLRTSPILRGNWIITNLFGMPTPPPPANVPPLPEEEVVSKDLTLKQQLESHRKSPQCKGCHQKIDPLGFPLENFDPLGRWRTKYENAPIDATAQTSDGKTLIGPEGLKKYLLRHKDDFMRQLARKLLAYALGRSIEYYDFYLINKMVESSKKDGFKFYPMVMEIVKSYQFRHKG